MLLARSADGDLAAFEAFAHRHQASVRRFCASLTRADEEVEDVLQETFLAAWRKSGTYAGRGSAKSWLFTIARRSYYRGRRRARPTATDDEALEELGCRAGWGAPESGEKGIETRAIVREVFARLAPADRQVLLLRDVEGLSTREAARALGVEARALKSRLHRARLRMMALLREGTRDGR